MPVWNINSAIEKTVRWYKAFYEKGDILTYQDLEDYINDAKNKDIEWTK
jgi:CDP-glucose 4,6-dehydratase